MGNPPARALGREGLGWARRPVGGSFPSGGGRSRAAYPSPLSSPAIRSVAIRCPTQKLPNSPYTDVTSS